MVHACQSLWNKMWNFMLEKVAAPNAKLWREKLTCHQTIDNSSSLTFSCTIHFDEKPLSIAPDWWITHKTALAETLAQTLAWTLGWTLAWTLWTLAWTLAETPFEPNKSWFSCHDSSQAFKIHLKTSWRWTKHPKTSENPDWGNGCLTFLTAVCGAEVHDLHSILKDMKIFNTNEQQSSTFFLVKDILIHNRLGCLWWPCSSGRQLTTSAEVEDVWGLQLLLLELLHHFIFTKKFTGEARILFDSSGFLVITLKRTDSWCEKTHFLLLCQAINCLFLDFSPPDFLFFLSLLKSNILTFCQKRGEHTLHTSSLASELLESSGFEWNPSDFTTVICELSNKKRRGGDQIFQ